MISNKFCDFILLYRSPSKSSDEFENFVYNLDLKLEALTQKNPYVTVIIGDFIGKFNKWCYTDEKTPERANLNISVWTNPTFKETNPHFLQL